MRYPITGSMIRTAIFLISMDRRSSCRTDRYIADEVLKHRDDDAGKNQRNMKNKDPKKAEKDEFQLTDTKRVVLLPGERDKHLRSRHR